MWAAGLLLLLGATELALTVDGNRDAFRQRVCLVSEVGSRPEGGAARAWWWLRFLLQELLDWAISLTASGCAIAACAVLLRRSQPQPALRPRMLSLLAEALQGGKAWVAFPQYLLCGFRTTPSEPHPSRSIQTPSRLSLNEDAQLDESASLEEEISEEVLPKDTESLAERASLQEKVSLAETAASHILSDSVTQEEQNNLIRTSEAWLTLYHEAAGGQEAASQRLGSTSEQLVATLSKYLDAVVTELRVTNSRLACVLPSLEHTVQQPKESREQAEARSAATSPMSPLQVIGSATATAPEIVDEAVIKLLRLSPRVPTERGDSDTSRTALEVSEAQTSASWLEAQEQLAQERRSCERRVITLERRLREVLSELHITRCQLAEALTAQELRHRKVPPLDTSSDSSVSLVSSTMDAMLSTVSVGSDSGSEVRSSASVSPASTCTVMYRSKLRPTTRSSFSSTSVAASDTFTSACTVIEDAAKLLPVDKKASVPHASQSSPAVLTPSTSLLDIDDAERLPDGRQQHPQARAKAPTRERHRPPSESASESSYISSVSESGSDGSDRKAAASSESSSWTEMSGNWMRAVRRLVKMLRTKPQEVQSSDQTPSTPESVPHSGGEPSDASDKQSEPAITSMVQRGYAQPAPSTSSETCTSEVTTSGRSLLSRMVNALLYTSSTTASPLQMSTPAEDSSDSSVAAILSPAEAEHIEDTAAAAEINASKGGLMSRIVSVILPASSTVTASVSQLRTNVEDSKPVSAVAVSSAAEVENFDRKRSIVSRVSCMDHQLSSVIILTPSPELPDGSARQTYPAAAEKKGVRPLRHSWYKASDEQPLEGRTKQEPLRETQVHAQAESISVLLPVKDTDQYALQEKIVAPGPDEHRDIKTPVAEPSRQTEAEESDTQQLVKEVTERTSEPILKDDDTQTEPSKETFQSLPKDKKTKPPQRTIGMQTQQKKRSLRSSLNEIYVHPKQLQESAGKELSKERGAHRSPQRKRTQKVQEKKEVRRPLKKSEDQETMKERKSQFLPKKDVQDALKKRDDFSTLKPPQNKPQPKSRKTQAPSKKTGDPQRDKREIQSPLEENGTQPVPSNETSMNMSAWNMALLPLQEIEVHTIPEEDESEVLVDDSVTRTLPDDEVIPELQRLQEPASINKEIESTESGSMVAASKSSCTQASTLWLQGLQRLALQLQAAPKPSEVFAASPQVDVVRSEQQTLAQQASPKLSEALIAPLQMVVVCSEQQTLAQQLQASPKLSDAFVAPTQVDVVPSEHRTPLQENVKQKVSSVADVCSESMLSCVVNTMLADSSSSAISAILSQKHRGVKDKFSSKVAEDVDDTKLVAGGASGDSVLIREEEELEEVSIHTSPSRDEESCDQTSEITVPQNEIRAITQSADEKSCADLQLQEKKARASVTKSSPTALQKRREPGTPIKKDQGETLPTEAVATTVPKKECISEQRMDTRAQIAKKKHMPRPMRKKREVHKLIEERLDEEPEDQGDAELIEERKENLTAQPSADSQRLVVPFQENIAVTSRKSRFAALTGTLRWLSHPLKAAALRAKGFKEMTSLPLSSDSVIEEKSKSYQLSSDNHNHDFSKQKTSTIDTGASKKSLISCLVNAIVSDSSVPTVPLPPARSPSIISGKNESTVFICTMVDSFDSGSATADSVSEDSNTSLQKRQPGSLTSALKGERLQPLQEGSGDQLLQALDALSEQRLPTPAKSDFSCARGEEKKSVETTPTTCSSWTHTYNSWLQNQQQLMHQLHINRLEAEISELPSSTHDETALNTVRLSSSSQRSRTTVPCHSRDQVDQMGTITSPSNTSTLKDWQPSLEDFADQVLTAEGVPQVRRPPSHSVSDIRSYIEEKDESYGDCTLVKKRSSWTEAYMSWLENQELLAKQLHELRLRNETREGHSAKRQMYSCQVPTTTALSASRSSLLSGVVSAMMADDTSTCASASATSSISASVATATTNHEPSATSTFIPTTIAASKTISSATHTTTNMTASPSVTLVSPASIVTADSGISETGTYSPFSNAASPINTFASSIASVRNSCATSPNITIASSISNGTAVSPSTRTGSYNTSSYAGSPGTTSTYSANSQAISPNVRFPSPVSRVTATSASTARAAYVPRNRVDSPTSKFAPSSSKATTTCAPSTKGPYTSSKRTSSPSSKFDPSASKATSTSASKTKRRHTSSKRVASPASEFSSSTFNVTTTSVSIAQGLNAATRRAASPTHKFAPSASNVTTISAASRQRPCDPRRRSISPTKTFAPPVYNADITSASSANDRYSHSSRANSPTITSNFSNVTAGTGFRRVLGYTPGSNVDSSTINFVSSTSRVASTRDPSKTGIPPISSFASSAASGSPTCGTTQHPRTTIAAVTSRPIAIGSLGSSVAKSYSPSISTGTPAFGISVSSMDTTRSRSVSAASTIITPPPVCPIATTACTRSNMSASPTIIFDKSVSGDDTTSAPISCVPFPSSTCIRGSPSFQGTNTTAKKAAVNHLEGARSTTGHSAVICAMDYTTSRTASNDSPIGTVDNEVRRMMSLSTSGVSLLSGAVNAMLAAKSSTGASASTSSSTSAYTTNATTNYYPGTSSFIPTAITTSESITSTTYTTTNIAASPPVTLVSSASNATAVSGGRKTFHGINTTAKPTAVNHLEGAVDHTISRTAPNDSPIRTSKNKVRKNKSLSASGASLLSAVVNDMLAANSSTGASTSACSSFSASVANATTNYDPSATSAFIPTTIGASESIMSNTYTTTNLAASPSVTLVSSASNATAVSGVSKLGFHASSSNAASPTISFASPTASVRNASHTSTTDNPYSRTYYWNTKSYDGSPGITSTYSTHSKAISPTVRTPSSVSTVKVTSASNAKGDFATTPTSEFAQFASNVTTISAYRAKHLCEPSRGAISPTNKITSSSYNADTISASSANGPYSANIRANTPTITSSFSNATGGTGFSRLGAYTSSNNAQTSTITFSSSTSREASNCNHSSTFASTASSGTPVSGTAHHFTAIAKVTPRSIAIWSSGSSVANSYTPGIPAITPAITFGSSVSSMATTCSPSSSTASPIISFPSLTTSVTTDCGLSNEGASSTITNAKSVSSESTTSASISCLTSPVITFPSSASITGSTFSSDATTFHGTSTTVKSMAVNHVDSASESTISSTTYPTASSDSPITTVENQASKKEDKGIVVVLPPAVPEVRKEKEMEAEEAYWLVQARRLMSALPLPKGPGP